MMKLKHHSQRADITLLGPHAGSMLTIQKMMDGVEMDVRMGKEQTMVRPFLHFQPH